jgi:uncharacterized oxidoreductase
MKTTGNTILITGGSAGIGMEMARQFVALGNTVIITGRDAKRLENAAAQLGNTTAIAFDVTKANDVETLVKRITADFPKLNVVINNAGSAGMHHLLNGSGAFAIAENEMLTNYLSVIRLNEKLLPLLQKQAESAILNVSSIVAFAPTQHLPTYSASKAALHSYTKSLRVALSGTPVKVFELMPPLVNTEFSAPIGGENGIAPSMVAADVADALAHDRFEIRTGQTEDIYRLSLADPDNALRVINNIE